MNNSLTLQEARNALGIYMPMSLNWIEMSHFYALYTIATKGSIYIYPFPLSYLINTFLERDAVKLIKNDYKTLTPQQAELLYIEKAKNIIITKSYIYNTAKNTSLFDKISS